MKVEIIACRGFLYYTMHLNIPILFLLFYFLPMDTKAQENWITPINIGRHIDVNDVEEKNISMEKATSLFNNSGGTPIDTAFLNQLEAERNNWLNSNIEYYFKRFKSNRAFHADSNNPISCIVQGFSDKDIRIFVLFSIGFSRWHNYYYLQRNYIIH